jgi:hypothetical protein
MPAFGEILSPDDRWALIDYIHAHLAGVTMADQGLWKTPVVAPSLAAVCSDGKELALSDLRGKFVRIVALGPNDAGPAASENPTVVLLTRRRVEMPGCVAEGDAPWEAYSVLAHLPPDKLAGTQFLIDPAGWVRWSLTPADAGIWSDSAKLQAMIQDVAAHPLAASAASGHHHH